MKIRKVVLFIPLLSFFACHGQIKLPKALEKVQNVVDGKGKLTNEEVIDGLKEALTKGAEFAAKNASKEDGFYKNQLILIPFPEEAKVMEEKLRAIGMGHLVDDFVMTLNRAAENAAKSAAPIFIDAVKSMSLKEGWDILRGDDRAATSFLESRTKDNLTQTFLPVVKTALQTVDVTSKWTPVVNAYNKIPLVKKLNPDLEVYTTEKAVRGMFVLIGEEEAKIRKDPKARITPLLEKVFGSQDK
jgi:hypothetical protein